MDDQTGREHLRGVVENMTEGVVIFDAQRQIIYVNQALTAFTGLGIDKVTLADLINLIEKEYADHQGSDLPLAEVEKGIWKKISFHEAVDITISLGQTVKFPKTSLNNRFFEMTLFPVSDRQGVPAGGAVVLYEITQLVEVDQMKTEFVSVASHQLRTPLTAIRLFLEMLANEQVGPLNQQQKEYINNVQESTLRMIRLVNDFLNVSRIESGRLKITPQMTQLADLIVEVVNEMQLLAKEKGCQLTFDLPAEALMSIPVDRGLLREVLKNLVSNAISYSPAQSGQVSISLQKKLGAALLTSSGAAAIDSQPRSNADQIQGILQSVDYLVIGVQDNGMGIPEEIKGRIFEKFFRGDNAIRARSEGSGLGLYLVKMIMEASGGKVWFASSGGQGTIFSVAIPVLGMLKREGEKNLTG